MAMDIEKPFTHDQNKSISPGLVYLVLFVGGGGSPFSPPLPYIWSSAHAAHLLVSVQMNSCLPEQLLSGNWINAEENSFYPNSWLPGNFCYKSIIFSAHAPCLA